MQRLDHALRLARRGFRVFPVIANGRSPAFKGWQAAATTDEAIITAWFTGAYRDNNIGVATGQGVLVLDCDAKHGKLGLRSLEDLDMLGLPHGYRVRTPSGGVHVYLKIDAGIPITVSVDALENYPGIDVRCEGGLVVAPGSTIDGREYVEIR